MVSILYTLCRHIKQNCFPHTFIQKLVIIKWNKEVRMSLKLQNFHILNSVCMHVGNKVHTAYIEHNENENKKYIPFHLAF